MAGSRKGLAISSLLLRVVAMSMLSISVYLIVTDTVIYSFGSFNVKFENIIAYRYVLATSCIGLFYSLLLIPVMTLIILTRKDENVTRIVDMCIVGDKVISFLLATGVGAGFLVSIDVIRLVHELLSDGFIVSEVRTKLDKYLKRGIISTAFLLGGSLCMLVSSVLVCLIRYGIKSTGFFS